MVTQDYINDIKIGTNVIDGDEYKDTLEAVSEITCNIVAKTLGPYASTTVIDDGGSTYSTKDGWSVVNRLRFSDPIENILFSFIKDRLWFIVKSFTNNSFCNCSGYDICSN